MRGEGSASLWLAPGARTCQARIRWCADVASWLEVHFDFPAFSTRFCLFTGCLGIVAVLAQALQIAPVGEQRPVPTVGPDVVYYRGPGAHPPPGTGAAPRLGQELGRPQVLRPDGKTVQVVPLR